MRERYQIAEEPPVVGKAAKENRGQKHTGVAVAAEPTAQQERRQDNFHDEDRKIEPSQVKISRSNAEGVGGRHKERERGSNFKQQEPARARQMEHQANEFDQGKVLNAKCNPDRKSTRLNS